MVIHIILIFLLGTFIFNLEKCNGGIWFRAMKQYVGLLIHIGSLEVYKYMKLGGLSHPTLRGLQVFIPLFAFSLSLSLSLLIVE